MAYRVIVELQHDCTLVQLRRCVGIDFQVYCNGYFDFFIFDIKPESSLFEKIIDFFEYELPENTEVDLDIPYLILKCNGKGREHLMHFYNDIFQNHGIVFAYPTIKENGESYLYHCLDNSSHARVLNTFQENFRFIIESITEYSADEYYGAYMFSISDIANELTRNQTDILSEAYELGYYQIPRTIRTEDIAMRRNKTRYTIDKTLRAAENKIMKFIYRFLL